jgi:excisionase family DNA binding protein
MELLTVSETAQILRVSPLTVRRYIAAGRLPAVKVGKGVRVRKEAVDELVRPVEPTMPVEQPGGLPMGRPTSAEDPLWSIIGIGESCGPTDVASNKHKYLADAYSAEGQ